MPLIQIGQRAVTEKRGDAAVHLERGVRDLKILIGVEITGDAVSVRTVHGDGGETVRVPAQQLTARREFDIEDTVRGITVGKSATAAGRRTNSDTLAQDGSSCFSTSNEV